MAMDAHPGSSILPLVRETADSIGDLIHGHLKLARLELISDGKEFGKQALWLGGFSLLGVIGYVFCMVAVAAALEPRVGAAASFLIVGAVHVVGAAGGLVFVLRRKPQPQLMDHTLQEVQQSVSEIAADTSSKRGPEQVETARGH
jgi:uncharacterized membrane protein YqjE